jgi:lysophospholipase L1-like esterase
MPARPARHYSVSEVALVLLVAALTAVAFDSQGLLTWVGRKSVGRFQSALLFVLVPAHRGLSRVGLTWPLHAAHQAADALAVRWAGSTEDALPAANAEALLPGDVPDAGPDLLEMDPVLVVGLEPFDAGEASDAGAIALVEVPDAGELDAGEALATTEPADAGVPEHLTVLLVGDSMMAAGLASAISRGLEDEVGVRVVKAYKEATGLSRPDVYDWMEVLPPVLAHHRPDLVICSLGGNDTQSIRQGDEVLEAGTRRWRTEYRHRVRRFMQLLAGSGRQVLWLGLPVMRSPEFNERAERMNDIFEQEAQGVSRVHYLEASSAVAGPDGAFTSFGPDAQGNLVQLRMDDGVHYTRAGGEAVAQRALAWIRERRSPSVTASLQLPSPPPP